MTKLSQPLRTYVLALALSVANVSLCHAAADFCVSSNGLTYVAKAFKVPKAGKCSSWQGFILGLPGDPDNTSTGTACASSADPMDLHVDFAITTVVEGGANVFFDHLSLPAPSLTGGDRDTSTLASGFVGSFPGMTSSVPCATKVVPNPSGKRPMD